MARKSSENRFQRASQASHATEISRSTLFSSFRTPKSCPRSLRGVLGGLLRLLWDPPGRQLGLLGALLGALWRLGGRSWALLARSWRRFFSQILETSSARPDFRRLALHLVAKTCEIQPKTCEILAKTCQQRRASNVGLQQGCGGRAKRVQYDYTENTS